MILLTLVTLQVRFMAASTERLPGLLNDLASPLRCGWAHRSVIPRQILVVWKHPTLSGIAEEYHEEWRQQEPCFERRVVTDGECLTLAERANMSAVYAWYPLNVMRADACRLLAVFFYGGMYLDIDVERGVPLRSWWDLEADVMLGREFQWHKTLTNWFFAATAGHRCFARAIQLMIRRAERIRRTRSHLLHNVEFVHDLTGPWLLTDAMLGCQPNPPRVRFTEDDVTRHLIIHHFNSLLKSHSYRSWKDHRNDLLDTEIHRIGSVPSTIFRILNDNARRELFSRAAGGGLRPLQLLALRPAPPRLLLLDAARPRRRPSGLTRKVNESLPKVATPVAGWVTVRLGVRFSPSPSAAASAVLPSNGELGASRRADSVRYRVDDQYTTALFDGDIDTTLLLPNRSTVAIALVPLSEAEARLVRDRSRTALWRSGRNASNDERRFEGGAAATAAVEESNGSLRRHVNGVPRSQLRCVVLLWPPDGYLLDEAIANHVTVRLKAVDGATIDAVTMEYAYDSAFHQVVFPWPPLPASQSGVNVAAPREEAPPSSTTADHQRHGTEPPPDPTITGVEVSKHDCAYRHHDDGRSRPCSPLALYLAEILMFSDEACRVPWLVADAVPHDARDPYHHLASAATFIQQQQTAPARFIPLRVSDDMPWPVGRPKSAALDQKWMQIAVASVFGTQKRQVFPADPPPPTVGGDTAGLLA